MLQIHPRMSGTQAPMGVLRETRMWLDARGHLQMLGRPHDAGIMAHITTEKYECIWRDTGQTTKMTNGMTRTIQKVERAVAEIVRRRELPNPYSIWTVERDFTKPATTSACQRDGVAFHSRMYLTCNHFLEWATRGSMDILATCSS